MNNTKPDDVQKWIGEIEKSSIENIQWPDFLKPYHFVTLGLAIKRLGKNNFKIPENLSPYAARMKLHELLGITTDYKLNEKSSDGKFLPLELFYKDNRLHTDSTANKLVNIAVKNAPVEYKDALGICLLELINNFFDHSDSQNELPCLVCAQSWPKGNLVQIALADLGIGIRRSLSESKNNELINQLKTTNACKIASEYGNTSKASDHSGYGLTLAKDLMKYANGTYILLSGNELFAYNNEKEIDKTTNSSWKGTIVVLELKLDTMLDITPVYESWSLPEGFNQNDFF